MDKTPLTTYNPVFKPFRFPWAFELWEMHEAMHWLPKEVPLADDVKDWNTKISTQEKNLLTQVFRFFTQQDVLVGGAYVDQYLKVFQPTEVRMMLMGFASRECYDADTEVLTNKGWVTFPNLTDEMLVGQYDVGTKEISFAQPSDYIIKNYSGEMHYYQSDSSNLMVTPGHRLVLINPHTRKTQLKKSSEGLWGRNFLYPSAGYAVGEEESVSDMERLLVAIQADGCVRSHCPSHSVTKKTVDINVTKQRKIQRVTELLTACGLNCNPRLKDNGQTVFTFTLPESVDHLNIKNMGFININRVSARKAKLLLEEVLFWDGTVAEKENGVVQKAYYNTNLPAVDTVQAIATLAGVSSIRGINRPAQEDYQILDNRLPSTTKTCYVVTFCDQVERSYPHRKSINYDGLVYCVTMPKGTVVTRRNGRVAVSGNCIHVAAYAHLLDTIGLPEVEYSAFFKYKEMKDKFEYAQQFNTDTPMDTAKALAAFSAFMEGLQLFASFAILLNFPRFNKMKGMGQIVSWSIRDESIHVEAMIRLFRSFIEENIELWNDDLKKQIYDICREMVDHEDKFIDLAFEMGGVEGMTPEDIKQYIRYIADRRLTQMGLKPNYGVTENPLPWVDEMVNAPEFANFFEQRVTEYSRASTTGTWEEAFGDDKWEIYGQANCPQCVEAKKLLESKNISFVYHDLTNQPKRKMELYEETQAKSMPMIFKNDEFFGSIFTLRESFK